jgi:sugar phosphate isomerase/epimerase
MTTPTLPDRAVPPILISLSSFGAAEVLRHGQLWFTRLSAQAGADGVEVRGELLQARHAPALADAPTTQPATAGDRFDNSLGDELGNELDAIAEAVRSAGLQLVYSSPDGLWTTSGDLDLAALEHAMGIAQHLGAPRLKMAIGGYGAASAASLAILRDRLAKTSVELVIENDQTTSAGTLPALQAFFDNASQVGLSLGMTFDMGNWHWQGECPVMAAQSCAPRVSYVHCKGVQRQPQRWVAVPLDDSAAPWRAVLRALPAGLPMAIEYPLVGDDLLAVTRGRVEQLRGLARRAA